MQSCDFYTDGGAINQIGAATAAAAESRVHSMMNDVVGCRLRPALFQSQKKRERDIVASVFNIPRRPTDLWRSPHMTNDPLLAPATQSILIISVPVYIYEEVARGRCHQGNGKSVNEDGPPAATLVHRPSSKQKRANFFHWTDSESQFSSLYPSQMVSTTCCQHPVTCTFTESKSRTDGPATVAGLSTDCTALVSISNSVRTQLPSPSPVTLFENIWRHF